MNADNATIEVPATLTIYEVGELATRWRTVLAAKVPDRLCLEALNEIDAAGFQLLVSLVKSLAEQSFKGEVRYPSHPTMAAWLEKQITAVLEGRQHA